MDTIKVTLFVLYDFAKNTVCLNTKYAVNFCCGKKCNLCNYSVYDFFQDLWWLIIEHCYALISPSKTSSDIKSNLQNVSSRLMTFQYCIVMHIMILWLAYSIFFKANRMIMTIDLYIIPSQMLLWFNRHCRRKKVPLRGNDPPP